MSDSVRSVQIREISIEQWRRLVADGAELAVHIPLNGVSMQPLVRRLRDRVTIIPIRRPLRKGDIVLFQRADGVYVVHRLIAIGEQTVQTLGDNCPSPDSPIPVSSVLGIVTYVQRGKRRLHVDSSAWRLAGRIWSAIRPIRKGLHICRRAAKRVGRKMLGRNRK